MKFLIDGHRNRVDFRKKQWPDGVAGQLLTPLTRYTRGHDIYGIDNGAFSNFNEKKFLSLLKREHEARDKSLFIAIPDIVGSHKDTLLLYDKFCYLGEDWNLAFVAQDGYDGMPDSAGALFIGGTNAFKDSDDAIQAVMCALNNDKHVHVGRVNTPDRFKRFYNAGANTCDGSGVSRYDHMLPKIRDYMENRFK